MSSNPCRECGAPVSAEAHTCPKCGVKSPLKKTVVPLWAVLAVVLFALWGIGNSFGAFDSAATGQDQSAAPRQDVKIIADIPPSAELLKCIDRKMLTAGGYFTPQEYGVAGTGEATYSSAGDTFKNWLWSACWAQARAWILNECMPQTGSSRAICELPLNGFASNEFDKIGLEMAPYSSPSWIGTGLKVIKKGSEAGVPLWRAMEMTHANPFISNSE